MPAKKQDLHHGGDAATADRPGFLRDCPARQGEGPLSSVDVSEVAFFLFYEGFRDPLGGLIKRFTAMLGNDRHQGCVNVFGHSLCVAADVEERTLVQPAPEFSTLFFHAVLDIDFFGLISGKRSGEFVKESGFLGSQEFIAVKEVGFLVLISEKEPIATRMAMDGTVLKKGPKRGDTGSRADHDHVAIRWRRMKMAGGLDIDGDRRLVGQMSKVTGGEPLFFSAVGGVLDEGNGQMRLSGTVVG
jgi:hypothetical protein